MSWLCKDNFLVCQISAVTEEKPGRNCTLLLRIPASYLPSSFSQTTMGLLSLGTPLSWDDAKPYIDHVRHHGITQFLNIWDRLKDRHGDELLWGDEVSPNCMHLQSYVSNHHTHVRLNTWLFPLTPSRKLPCFRCVRPKYWPSYSPPQVKLTLTRITREIFKSRLISWRLYHVSQDICPDVPS